MDDEQLSHYYRYEYSVTVEWKNVTPITLDADRTFRETKGWVFTAKLKLSMN